MNTYLNYLIEANLGLLVLYGLYLILLKNENQFSFKRAYLLGSLVASLVFPLISIPSQEVQFIPSLSNNFSSVYWLPEITIFANAPVDETTSASVRVWQWIIYIYLVGVALLFLLFLVRIALLVSLFVSSKKFHWKKYTVAEPEKGHGSFSFFNLIFLGKASELSENEKLEVLTHEEVHAQKLHSLDIVLVNALGIVFWFNPVLLFYRNSLVQVHEFEADARSVEGRDVDMYCSLLAKVALQSNGYTLANHFTNSLTLKRIVMMKTLRKKIQQWKVGVASIAVLLLFFVVACNDQAMQEANSKTTSFPEEVETELARLKQANPTAEYVVMEMSDEGRLKFEKMMEDKVASGEIIFFPVVKNSDHTFLILQDNRNNVRTQLSGADGDVFSVVEETSKPIGDYPVLYEYISKNMKYPQQALSMGIEGKVFVEFVVNTDGTLSDVRMIKGIGAGCDLEAVNVMKNSQIKWNPAKHEGKLVRQKMVIPITFKLG
jgi:TonB family protein